VETEDALVQLAPVEGDLVIALTEYWGKDGRNVAMRVLHTLLAFVREIGDRCMARAADCQPGRDGAVVTGQSDLA